MNRFICQKNHLVGCQTYKYVQFHPLSIHFDWISVWHSTGDIAIFIIFVQKNENWLENFGCYHFYLLCERKGEFTSIKIGQMLFVSSNMKAMPVNMTKMHTPLLDTFLVFLVYSIVIKVKMVSICVLWIKNHIGTFSV